MFIPNTKDSDYMREIHLETRTLCLYDHWPFLGFSSMLAASQDTKKSPKARSSEVTQLSPSIISANPGSDDQVLYSSSNIVTSRMSDHNNLMSSRYLSYLKCAFSLMIAIDKLFASRERNFNFKQGHVQYQHQM